LAQIKIEVGLKQMKKKVLSSFLISLIIVAIFAGLFHETANAVTDFTKQPELIDTWVCPITAEMGDYQSLTGDGTFLFWVGAQSRTLFHVRKIRISDMEEVASYAGSGNAYDFASISVVGSYVYLGIGYNSTPSFELPKVLKIDKNAMTLVSSFNLSGNSAYYPELYPDTYYSDILWIGSMRSSYTPIIHKINLTTFTEVATQVYTIGGCDGGSPAICDDETYLYCFVKYGGFFRVKKSDLSYDGFTDITIEEYPRRWLQHLNGFSYVVQEADKLAKYEFVQKTTNNRIYNFGFENGTYTPWTGAYSDIMPGGKTGYHSSRSSYTGWISQTLQDSIGVENVSTFNFWGYMTGTTKSFKVTVTYTDDSTTAKTYTSVPTSWTLYDFKSELVAGKTIKSLRFDNLGTTGDELLYLDDVSILDQIWWSWNQIEKQYHWIGGDWIEGLVHFSETPEYFYVIDMEPTNAIWKLKDNGTAFQMLYYWQVPYANSSDIYTCWSYTDANGKQYVFMADWCGDNPDAIYKVEIKPEIYITSYSVEEPSEILNVNFTINGSNFTTPKTLYVSLGTYTFTALNLFPIINGTRYDFKYWLIPGVWYSSRPTITRTITAYTTLVIYYHKTYIPTSPEMYSLHVTSEPELNVNCTINYVELTTPATIQIPAGTYMCTVIDTFPVVNATNYAFTHWHIKASPEIDIYSATTDITVTGDANITLHYFLGFFRKPSPIVPPEELMMPCFPLTFYIIMVLLFFGGLYLYTKRELWLISVPIVPVVAWLLWRRPCPPYDFYIAIVLAVITVGLLLNKLRGK
jgi:hypothetical protein